MGEKRNEYRLLVRKPKGKRLENQEEGGWIMLIRFLEI
jgi:hypothetical protein